MTRIINWIARDLRQGKDKDKDKRSRPRRVELEMLEERWMPSGVNPIVAENLLPGTPQSQWDIPSGDAGDPTLQGFATDMSVNRGQTVQFKINDASGAPYRMELYRMGYYQGNGARLVGNIPATQTLRVVQPAPIEHVSGLIDCGNWQVTASWAVPANAVSGIYFAKLVREDTGGSSHIVFVVRDDNNPNPSDILLQTSDTTWQAYNSYGGNSLYGKGTNPLPGGCCGACAFPCTAAADRGFAVSYNRPFTTRETAPINWVFANEYPMVRWLESNGYSVSYFSGVDGDRYGAQMAQHKLYVTVGHDEYWSGQQRTNVEQAIAQGVNVAFLTGNDMFWKTRWEPSTLGSQDPYRTMVCYKESFAGTKIDPAPVWTGLWRDPTISPPYDGGRPENAVTGQLFMVNGNQYNSDSYSTMEVPSVFSKLRFWRNTAVAQLAPGSFYTLPLGTLGFEWNETPDNGFQPASSFWLSTTTRDVAQKVQDHGTNFAPGTATHHLNLYRNGSALVFGAGTVNYAWGLDPNHDLEEYGGGSDVNLQQATVNLFADMRALPGSLRPGLVPAATSTDALSPLTSITSPASAQIFLAGTPLTITGTATDRSGGVVAGVQVSVDGGQSWNRATMSPAAPTTTWSFAWTPGTPGSINILTRAVDDSGNLETPSGGATVTVITQGFTLFSAAAHPTVISNDARAIELGVKFTSDIAGTIGGIRFYRGQTGPGTNKVNLWTTNGQLLATATATGGGTGWQQANFATPVAISANTTYVASYFAPNGNFPVDANYFIAGLNTPPLHAPSTSSVAGGNGVYAYNATSTFPSATYSGSNYWVDVVFTNTNTATPIIYSTGPAAGAASVSTNTQVTLTFNKPMNGSTITSSTVFLKDSGGNTVPANVVYHAGTSTVFLTPSAALAPATSYTLTVLGTVTDQSGIAMGSNFTSSFFTSGPAPVIAATAPAAGTTGVSNAANLSLTFSHAMNPASLTPSTIFLKTESGTPVPASVSYNPATYTVSLTTQNFLFTNTTYTITVVGGSSGVKDLNGLGLAASSSWSFTTSSQGTIYPHLWTPTTTPAVAASADTNSITVGVKFTSAETGAITGIRFYKGPGNTGTHVGSLWSATGQLLASATFTSETDSGWQQVDFATPVMINANTTYVASYLAPVGRYSVDSGYFTTVGRVASPLQAPVSGSIGGNGVYAYGSVNTFPGNSYNGANYWVDVVFSYAPAVTSLTPAAGAGQVNVNTSVAMTFGHAMDTSTLTSDRIFLQDGNGNIVPATLSYNAANFTVTLTPNAPLSQVVKYTLTVLGGSGGVKDSSGNAMLMTHTSSFFTNGPAPVISSMSVGGGGAELPVGQDNTVQALTGVDGGTATPSVTFSHAMNPGTITSTTVVLRNASGTIMPATVSYNPGTLTATLTPYGVLSASTSYTLTVQGGSNGVGDPNGLSLASTFVAPFTTAAQSSFYPSLWRPTVTPTAISTDTNSVEVGVKFNSTVTGYVTGVRFYKAEGNTGTHIGSLWNTTGQRLATATFTSETASGWQQVNFATPVLINPNTNYIASYFAPVGRYAATGNYFDTSYDSYPLHAPSTTAAFGNGAYAYASSSSFPGSSYNGANYWVDVVFSATPAVTATTPASGAGQVNRNAPLTITFNQALDATTLNTTTLFLQAANGNLVPASVSYSAATLTATLTPSAELAGNSVYTANVLGGSSGVKSASGQSMASTYSWSFMTEGAAPTVTATTPSAGLMGVSNAVIVSVTFSHALNPATVNGNTFRLTDPSGNVVPAVVAYDPATGVATLTTRSFLATATSYTATVVGGASGVKDLNGVAMAANYTWSFSTAAHVAFYPSLWRGISPTVISADTNSVELGVKFTVTMSGSITGVRFYKGAGNSGTHIGNLWTATGQLLARATFTAETGTGWQQVDFAEPVQISPNTTYVASYFAPAGHYAVEDAYFNDAGVNAGALQAPSAGAVAGNGVYAYSGSTTFPSNSYNGSNYWVDVVFATPPLVVASNPANGATNVSTSIVLSVTFDRAMDAATINNTTVRLTDAGGNVVAAVITYDVVTSTMTLRPSAPLNANTTYTVTIDGGSIGARVKDAFGNYLAASYVWSFTTGSS